MQFYIVQGKVFNDSLLLKTEERIDTRLAIEFFKNNAEKKSLLDSIENSLDKKYVNILKDSILLLARREENFKPYSFQNINARSTKLLVVHHI